MQRWLGCLVTMVVVSSARTITVSQSSGADYRTIQQAVGAARPGDEIVVGAGTYSAVEITRGGIALSGSGPDGCVIDGGRSAYACVQLECKRPVTLSGFTLRNAKSHGVYVRDGHHRISRCLITKNGDRGILLTNTAGDGTADIDYCTIADNKVSGIYSYKDHPQTTVTNCIVAFNRRGVVTDEDERGMLLDYNCFFNENNDFDEVSPGRGNLFVDPLFASIRSGDFHLSPASPCSTIGCFAVQSGGNEGATPGGASLPNQATAQPLAHAPSLSSAPSLSTRNGDQTLDGGEKVALAVAVTNSGEGPAKGVVVKLSGASKALQYIGTSQSIGDVGPGVTKEAKFEATLPNRIESDNGNIIIRVTEANGFDALEEKELIVAMQPAKVTRETQVVSTLVDVDAPLEASGYTRNDAYAVVVGISGYRSQVLPKVTHAKKDAEAVRDYLVGVCGFKEGNIKLLTDDGASLSDLTAYCEEWLARNVREGSFVFVYFAGHGTPSPDKGEAYLVPYDGEPGFVSKLYPLSRLYASLAALPTDHVVVALDACFSGAGGRSVMEQGKRPLVAVDLEKEAQKLGNVAVLTASAGNEISQDLDAKRHGLFTYYLLKGLRGEADADKDGWVTVKELYDYAKPKVLDESQRLGYTQTLQLLPPGARAAERVAKVK